jgi:hypothetical protein
MLVSGTALDDSVTVIRHRRRPTTIAVVWSDRGSPPGDRPTPARLRAGDGDRSGSRS